MKDDNLLHPYHLPPLLLMWPPLFHATHTHTKQFKSNWPLCIIHESRSITQWWDITAVLTSLCKQNKTSHLQYVSMVYLLSAALLGNLPFCLFQQDLQAGAGLASPHQGVVEDCTSGKGRRWAFLTAAKAGKWQNRMMIKTVERLANDTRAQCPVATKNLYMHWTGTHHPHPTHTHILLSKSI